MGYVRVRLFSPDGKEAGAADIPVPEGSTPQEIGDQVKQAIRAAFRARRADDCASVTRFEVIDHAPGAVSYHPDVARSLVATNVKVELSIQDEGRTLKVFLTRLDA